MVKISLISILVILVKILHCNISENDHQQDSRVLYSFVANKTFGQLLAIFPKIFVSLKMFGSEFSYIEVWFTDQNSNFHTLKCGLLIKILIFIH